MLRVWHFYVGLAFSALALFFTHLAMAEAPANSVNLTLPLVFWVLAIYWFYETYSALKQRKAEKDAAMFKAFALSPTTPPVAPVVPPAVPVPPFVAVQPSLAPVPETAAPAPAPVAPKPAAKPATKKPKASAKKRKPKA